MSSALILSPRRSFAQLYSPGRSFALVFAPPVPSAASNGVLFDDGNQIHFDDGTAVTWG